MSVDTQKLNALRRASGKTEEEFAAVCHRCDALFERYGRQALHLGLEQSSSSYRYEGYTVSDCDIVDPGDLKMFEKCDLHKKGQVTYMDCIKYLSLETDGKVGIQVAVLGQAGVGKTSLLQKYLLDQFRSEYVPTRKEGELVSAQLFVDKTPIVMELMDFPGNVDLADVPLSVDVFIFVFDLQRPETFSYLQSLVDAIKSRMGAAEMGPVLVIGNKTDLQPQLVSTSDAFSWCRTTFTNHSYFETSATLCSNVQAAFIASAKKGLRNRLDVFSNAYSFEIRNESRNSSPSPRDVSVTSMLSPPQPHLFSPSISTSSLGSSGPKVGSKVGTPAPVDSVEDTSLEHILSISSALARRGNSSTPTSIGGEGDSGNDTWESPSIKEALKLVSSLREDKFNETIKDMSNENERLRAELHSKIAELDTVKLKHMEERQQQQQESSTSPIHLENQSLKLQLDQCYSQIESLQQDLKLETDNSHTLQTSLDKMMKTNKDLERALGLERERNSDHDACILQQEALIKENQTLREERDCELEKVLSLQNRDREFESKVLQLETDLALELKSVDVTGNDPAGDDVARSLSLDDDSKDLDAKLSRMLEDIAGRRQALASDVGTAPPDSTQPTEIHESPKSANEVTATPEEGSINALKAKCEDYERSRQKCEQDLDAAREQVVVQKRACAEQSAKVSELQEELRGANSTINELKSLLAKATEDEKREISNMEDKIRALQGTAHASQEQTNGQTAACAQCATLRVEVTELKRQLGVANTALASEKDELARLQTLLDEGRSSRGAEPELKQEVTTLQGQVVTLRKSLSQDLLDCEARLIREVQWKEELMQTNRMLESRLQKAIEALKNVSTANESSVWTSEQIGELLPDAKYEQLSPATRPPPDTSSSAKSKVGKTVMSPGSTGSHAEDTAASDVSLEEFPPEDIPATNLGYSSEDVDVEEETKRLDREDRMKEFGHLIKDSIKIPPKDANEVDKLMTSSLTDLYLSDSKVKIIPLKKLKPGIFQYGTKKVHVSILHGDLVVRVGGGHVTVDDYVRRHCDSEHRNLNRKKPSKSG